MANFTPEPMLSKELPSRFETTALPMVTPESSPLCISVPTLRVAVLQPFPAPIPAPRVRVAGILLVPAPIPKPAFTGPWTLICSLGGDSRRPAFACACPEREGNCDPACCAHIPTPQVRVAGTQFFPAPMPVSGVRPARTQSNSTPVPIPGVRAAGIQQVPAPIPASGEPNQCPATSSCLRQNLSF